MAQSWADYVAETVELAKVDRLPVPQGPGQLDAGVWLARTVAEQDVEAGRAYAARRAYVGAGVRRLEEMPPQGLALYGVNDAARWTSGDTADAPVWRRPLPVTGAVIVNEMARAVTVVQEHAEGWQQAAGAYVWLRWLIGADEAIIYPLW